MSDWIHLSLKRIDVGQILDGLEVRENQWRGTASFLRTGEIPSPDFMPEDCEDEAEAEDLAQWYARIRATIRKQRERQPPIQSESKNLRADLGKFPRPCFCIYTHMFFQGYVPLVRNEENGPILYATKEGAERDLADICMERLHGFLAGEREFEDAREAGEFVVEVELKKDGSILDPWGKTFSNGSW